MYRTTTSNKTGGTSYTFWTAIYYLSYFVVVWDWAIGISYYFLVSFDMFFLTVLLAYFWLVSGVLWFCWGREDFLAVDRCGVGLGCYFGLAWTKEELNFLEGAGEDIFMPVIWSPCISMILWVRLIILVVKLKLNEKMGR